MTAVVLAGGDAGDALAAAAGVPAKALLPVGGRPLASYVLGALEASGKGTVYSYVVNHHPQVPAFDYPLPLGLIELAEGTRLVAEIVDCSPDDIKVGMAVTVTWIDADDELTLPAFKPDVVSWSAPSERASEATGQ